MNPYQDNVARFDALAPQWDQDAAHVRMAQKVGRAICNALQPQAHETALEFGAGTGLATLIVAPKVARLTAIDGSAGMLDVLRAKCERKGLDHVEVIQDNVVDLPLAHYDLIYSALTLHHVQDVPALLRKLAAHLNPGGRVALADLDSEDGRFHRDGTQGVVHHGFDRGIFGQWLRDAGLADVDFSTAWTVQREREDGSRASYPIFLAVAHQPKGH